MEEITVNLILMTMLAVVAIAIVRLSNLFAVVMLAGAYSLLSASIFVVLDAVDVAFTEAAVGAGVSTVLMLGTLALTRRHEKKSSELPIIPITVASLTGIVLLVATLDMPSFGKADAPIQLHVAPEYIEGAEKTIQVPNIVTAVLASYRGFDTLGEVAVVFTAGIAVLVLLGTARTFSRRKPADLTNSNDGDKT